MKQKPSLLLSFLMGAMLGIGIVGLIILGMTIMSGGNWLDLENQTMPVYDSSISIISPCAAQYSPDSFFDFGNDEDKRLLSQACELLNNGQSDQAVSLLLPKMKNWASNSDLAEANKIIGHAEMYMGHPKIAATYYEKLFIYQPTANHLFLLAYAYDSGGEIVKALNTYLMLDEYDNSDINYDKEFIQMRIEHLQQFVVTITPDS